MSDQKKNGSTLENGFKLLGEAFIPGASLLLDGQVKNGAGHAIVGLAARAFLGPIGALVVAANSFSTSVTGQGLVGNLKGNKEAEPEATTTTSAPQ